MRHDRLLFQTHGEAFRRRLTELRGSGNYPIGVGEKAEPAQLLAAFEACKAREGKPPAQVL